MKAVNITIYTTKQVATMFKVKKSTVRRWANEKIIPAKRIGKSWFFEEKVILDFFNTFNKNAKSKN